MHLGRRIVGVVGLLGIVLCLVATAGVWLLEARLTRSINRLVGVGDRSLGVVLERVKQSQAGVERSSAIAARLSEMLTGKIEDSDAVSRVRQELDQLESVATQVDHWLEVSQSALDLLGDTIRETNHPTLANSVASLNDTVASARSRLEEVTAAVGTIKQRTAAAGEQVIDEQSRNLVMQALSRLPEVDSHLQKLADGLIAAQGDLGAFHRRVNRWVALAAIVATVAFLWMGLGQFALCRWGWSGKRPLSATMLAAASDQAPKLD